MKYFLLFLRMLRYRVALTLLLFFFLGATSSFNLITPNFDYFFAIIALLCSYVVATTVNDIADEKIDRINHPNSQGIPLASKIATKRAFLFFHFTAPPVHLLTSLFFDLQS